MIIFLKSVKNEKKVAYNVLHKASLDVRNVLFPLITVQDARVNVPISAPVEILKRSAMTGSQIAWTAARSAEIIVQILVLLLIVLSANPDVMNGLPNV